MEEREKKEGKTKEEEREGIVEFTYFRIEKYNNNFSFNLFLQNIRKNIYHFKGSNEDRLNCL